MQEMKKQKINIRHNADSEWEEIGQIYRGNKWKREERRKKFTKKERRKKVRLMQPKSTYIKAHREISN